MLDADSLERAIGALCRRARRRGRAPIALDAERMRLLPAGILILDAAAQRLRQPLQIGRGGLREGCVLDMGT